MLKLSCLVVPSLPRIIGSDIKLISPNIFYGYLNNVHAICQNMECKLWCLYGFVTMQLNDATTLCIWICLLWQSLGMDQLFHTPNPWDLKLLLSFNVGLWFFDEATIWKKNIYAVNWCVSRWNGHDIMDVIIFFHITSGWINTWKGVNQLKELFFLNLIL